MTDAANYPRPFFCARIALKHGAGETFYLTMDGVDESESDGFGAIIHSPERDTAADARYDLPALKDICQFIANRTNLRLHLTVDTSIPKVTASIPVPVNPVNLVNPVIPPILRTTNPTTTRSPL